MKKLLSIFSIMLLLASCVNTTKKGETETTKTDLNLLSGEWVVEGYKADLQKNISPMKSGDKLKGNTGVCIGNVAGDSAFVLILINNHEAITGTIYANKPGKTEDSFAFKSDFESTDPIDIKLENGVLTLYNYGSDGAIMATDKFEYVAPFKDINDPCGLTATKLLLADKWTLFDAKDKKIGDLEIDSLGNLKGWSDYSIIRSLTDVALGGEDEILLSTGNSRGAINYVVDYKDKGNKVVLYEAIDSDELPTSKRGQQVYSLVRNNTAK